MKKKNGLSFSKIFGGSDASTIIRVSIMCIVMASIIVSFYYQLSHRLSSSEEKVKTDNELTICLTQDFVSNYPSSPKDVVRWYNRIITLFYSEKLKNSEVETLCDQVRALLDKELLAENPRDVYISSVKQDIQLYKARNSKIIEHDEGTNDDVVFATSLDGDNMAYVESYYFTQESNQYVSTYQTYCLRRDGSGKFKILAFNLTEEN